MKIIHNILCFCEVDSIPYRCVEIFKSPEFAHSIAEGLDTPDAFLRANWVAFIESILPFLIFCLTHPLLTQHVNSLMYSYISIIERTDDLRLFVGLRNLIQIALAINRPVLKLITGLDEHVHDMIFSRGNLFRVFTLSMQLH